MIQITSLMSCMFMELKNRWISTIQLCYRKWIYQKCTIKSSDITKDRDTRQVNFRLEGKKRSETGGLTSNLTLAENAFIRLTSNIDVTDGLVNGVRGIIQKLITNDEGSISVILVKFDD